MKEWIPIPGSNKDILIKAALEEFSAKGYKAVNISELAAKVEMTTGAVYHHFGSKAKLYEVIRSEMEQRLIDRMEGAASLFEQSHQALEAALITGLDFAVKMNLCKLLSEELPFQKKDAIEECVAKLHSHEKLPLEKILMAAWRTTLKEISEGKLNVDEGKKLLRWMFKRETS
ncbi:TetR/AcrR family transcriptional regulator [Cytobacillus purgationiresistens]|uniref:AcrR family transcriptional regulator n=1 Tax=Cytobacillus purgationiresistens TaxID=863449 RepID=A0ABU0AHN7_9BACI|nr:TetR/AcrR family transcriptional regulator [Cytobacillus purgationiresistens]MDQ0270570.1 AcrR family transcriptional regulator [Cytobacillus purgationiresistens]